MTDHKLVDIVKRGSDTWNDWRADHPEIVNPDLKNSYLLGANLCQTYKNKTSGANVEKAILTGCRIYGVREI